MQKFTFVIRAKEGLHARPAGLLVKCAQGCSSKVELALGEKSADCKRLFAVMGLCVKEGNSVSFTVTGENEEADAQTLRDFCEKNI